MRVAVRVIGNGLSPKQRTDKFGVPLALRGVVGICLQLLMMTMAMTLAASPLDDASLDDNPLQPTDTSSPRATLESFQQTSQRMVQLHRDRRSPTVVDQAVAKVLDTLDLSAFPYLHRIDQGVERAALLLEVLARIALPPLGEIPDAAAVEAHALKQWKIPNTDIAIARTEEGPDAGRFQFTRATIVHLPMFYELIKHLPPHPGSMAGFYEEWTYGPGPWIPYEWTTHLPKVAYIVLWHQRLWQWFASIAIVSAALVLTLLGYRLAQRIDQRSSQADNQHYHTRLVAMIVAISLLEFAARVMDDGVNLTGMRLLVMSGVLDVAKYGAIALIVILGLEVLGAAVIRVRQARPGSIDAALVRVVVRLLAIGTVFSFVIWIANSFGVPVTPLIASLGVGGLAIALAVRPTLENVIGGFILFADKPVRVGDFCRYGDQIGTVEEIGLRSTRIRSLERTTVTVPNAEFSQMKLDNFAKRDLRLLSAVLRLRYETTAEQMRWILATMRELLLRHPMVTPEPARVRFIGFGAYSKDVEIFAYLRCQDQDSFLAIQEDLLLRVENIVTESGSGFAIPSQTTYLSEDGTLDETRKAIAEAQVSQWRKRGRLPFPEFEEHDRDRFMDALDYPPKGSPHYHPHRSGLERHRDLASPFTEEDLVDLPSFVAKIRVGGPLSRHLFSQFSAETRALFSRYEGGADVELVRDLVKELNAVVCGPLLYTNARFEQVQLSPEARELLARAPEGGDLRRLNWLLLQDAYSSELAQRKVMTW